MEKDYTFYPTETESPRFLSIAQIEHFNRHGFISPLQGFSEAIIKKQQQYFDKLLQQISDASEKEIITLVESLNEIQYNIL